MCRNETETEEEGGCHKEDLKQRNLQSIFFGVARCCDFDDGYLDSGECKGYDTKVFV